MPSFETARRTASMKTNAAKTIGQIHKEQSDFLMEQTWDNDLQSKICYIYDYFHDDQKHLKSHMTYKNTTKTKIDAKFIVKSYQSIDKDQVEYYIQFKPSQKTEFCFGDELFYFETDYRERYGNDDFIGLYIDIPDDRNIYRKWMIVKKEIANQFVKYLVLPCNYEFMWIERNGQDKIKRRMWAVLRNQNSYNSGLWREYTFQSQENQKKCWLPLNSITERIWYTSDNSQNMRTLVGAYTENPIAWVISKVETANELGIQMLTLYQDFFDQHKDFIEKDSDGKIIGMWADYYSGEQTQTKPVEQYCSKIQTAKILASTSTVKIGGSYKTLTIKIYDADGTEITEQYSSIPLEWSCSVDGKNLNESIVTWRNGTSFNQKKMKFLNNRSYLAKVLNVKCILKNKNIKPIEAIASFDLTI